ncbi:hypothetical protein OFC62_42940, partial [Escherichia coli]|nr:hypothetical protein [Escherichia coli]
MMVTQQEGSSYDWAYWDETYDLLAHRDIAGYSERNLYVETLDALNLDLMSFITLDGQSLVSLSRENTPESSSSL